MNNYSFIFATMRIKDEAKIESIYNATLNLVKERGLAGITMSDIAKAASIATGTLYIYFRNKEDLIKELFWQCRDQSAKQYFEGLEANAPFEERLKLVFTNIVAYKVVRFEVSVFLEQTYHSPFVCITDLKKKQTALKPLLELFEEGIALKKLKAVDSDTLMTYMFGIIHELIKKAHFSGKKLSKDKVNQVYSLFWDGIRL
ncbi:MAG TPA: TetR/AcrR family transcriptional regulator [Flavisolibacter sp.]|jgi:AcrR family transcriptional regulator|nr:TetR/AcrR family transcriptional regulator [Flavisolibacter sp.]